MKAVMMAAQNDSTMAAKPDSFINPPAMRPSRRG